ncbi:glycosyltransferase [Solimonas flava]|uniref:glycosyltransferase n=1 Tax=Solimonas flava TaxID=415849 RepID=UPI00041D7F8B|nr:glycosyltransferase [Solimonas flava]
MAVTTSAPRVAFFLATSGHSGVDRLMRNLIPAVARRGYAVDQLKVRRHGPELGEAPGVRVVDLGAAHVWSALPPLVRYLRRERPLVMLSDKDKVNRAAVFARALAGADTRLVLRSGTTISVDLANRGPFERWTQRNSMRFCYRGAHAVVVPSDAAGRDLAAYAGLPPALIRTVPSPIVPASLFERRSPPPEHPWFAAGQPPVILGVGELSGRKDFATLIRAFAHLRRERACRLVILGRGGQREALQALAAELGVADDVDFPGFRDDVFNFMTHAAGFALTSKWEGMPVVLIEALASGTPVVSTDGAGGARELLRDGEIGALLPVGDDVAIAAALRRILDEPKDVARNVAAARRYEIESATDAYLAAMGLPASAPL